jgi:hypothetical protein
MLSQDTATQFRVATPLAKTKQVKLIREAYDSIPDLQDGFKDVREFLFDLNKQAEKRHRTGRPAQPLTFNDAAKLFTVSHLLDGHKQPDKWTALRRRLRHPGFPGTQRARTLELSVPNSTQFKIPTAVPLADLC